MDNSLIPNIKCPVCYETPRLAGKARYYTSSQRFYTPVFYCKTCNLYQRSTTSENINSHIEAASYAQLSLEGRWFENRHIFLQYLLGIIESQTTKPLHSIRLCDFGSAYGHLLQLAAQRGIVASGVEANRELVKSSRARGLSVIDSVANLETEADVITMIDSLYLLDDPLPTLRTLLTRLHPEGFMLIRITNRNWLATLRARLFGSRDFSILGDAIISYSLHSLTRLLKNAGLKVTSVVPDSGVGKKTGLLKTVAYRVLAGVSVASGHRLLISPGLIVIAEYPRQHHRTK